jgi:hypothetical protein
MGSAKAGEKGDLEEVARTGGKGGTWYGPRDEGGIGGSGGGDEGGIGGSGGGGENRRKGGLGMGPARKGGKEDLGELASAGGNVHALPLRQQSDGRAQAFEPPVKSGGDQKYLKLKFCQNLHTWFVTFLFLQ